ncbi:MAG: alpha/beta fold hydrolase [Bacteroidales bacterium]|nr:alpha/beta fold hydrolase [Bacteroidales bacterium]
MTFQVNAIKPNRVYSYTPDKMELTYEEFKVIAEDGVSLNVWHLPADNDGSPIIISQSDAGNMGDWLYLGLYLQAYGLDVWMYDYRGFGQSNDFAIVQDQLFHMEFVTDLDAVAEYVYQKTGKAPALMGLSMGTIIVNEFLRRTDIPIAKVIFDGYVASPKEWIERLAANGKIVTLPKGYRSRKYRLGKVESLFIVSEKDFYSTLSDIPKGQPDRNIKTFDCEHISGFFRFPEEYTTGIVSFIDVSL